MPNVAQRRVLVAAAVVGTVAFGLQPKLDVLGNPIGFWAFYSNQLPGYASGGGMFPDYRMMATESIALVFVTGCLYFAASGKRE